MTPLTEVFPHIQESRRWVGTKPMPTFCWLVLSPICGFPEFAGIEGVQGRAPGATLHMNRAGSETGAPGEDLQLNLGLRMGFICRT
jgi:hypothetical protein